MGVLKFLLLLSLLFPVVYATNGCSTSVCGKSSFTVRFPFRIQGQQTQNCGYPGFDLICNNQGIPVLNLPYSGEFFVRYINYRTQEIQLYDPSNCLPRRLLDLNLSGAPFMAAYYLNYTFLSCPSELTRSRFTVIDCLSNSTNTTLATSSMNLATAMTMCKILVTLPIPVSWPSQYSGFSADLNTDLQLTWNVPNCAHCEAQGAMCGIDNNTSQQVVCFYDPGTGKADGLQVFRIISFSIAIPAITCAFCIAFCICFINGGQHRGGANATQQNLDTATVTPQAPPDSLVTGLDETTIESYTKVVLGESRRLPVGPNNGTCPICLSEYRAKESVRCIPECKHCFHADCIDEWLRLNSTCPVCRNSPSPAHVNSQHV